MSTDIYVFTVIVSIFIMIGAFLPLYNAEIGEVSIDNQVTDLQDTVGNFVESETLITGYSVVLSIISMFFWTFGALPFAIDVVFIIFRIILVWLVVRMVRGVG